jgi:2-hydroxychromene-2-carboxylate isomerase
MKNVTYDFKEGQLIRLFHGVPDDAWTIYPAPTEELRRAIAWNDRNGDFDELERVHILEIFIHDFIRG